MKKFLVFLLVLTASVGTMTAKEHVSFSDSSLENKPTGVEVHQLRERLPLSKVLHKGNTAPSQQVNKNVPKNSPATSSDNTKEGVFVDDAVIASAFGLETLSWKVQYQTEELNDGLLELRIINPYACMSTGQDEHGLYDGYPYNDPGDWDESKDYNLVLHINPVTGKVVFVTESNELGVDWSYGMMFLYDSNNAVGKYVAKKGRVMFDALNQTLSFGMGNNIYAYAGFRFYLSVENYLADNITTKLGDLYYTFDEEAKTAEVMRSAELYSGEITIPESVVNNTITYSVTGIDEFAFRNCSGLTSVTIPVSMTSIGDGAFSGCSALTSVVWNAEHCNDFSTKSPFDGLSVSDLAFGTKVRYIPRVLCYKMKNLTSVTIPEGVTTIGRSAFNSCSNLASVSVSNSVTTIDYMAFARDSALTSITLPDNLTTIGTAAFLACISLTEITIPESVTTIDQGATFQDCSALTKVQWNAKDCTIEPYDGLYNYYLPFYNTNVTEFKFGDKVESIPPYLCGNLSGLTTVNLPNSVTTIGDGAFNGCTGLTSPIYNSRIFVLMPESFEGSYDIPSGIEIIHEYAFSGCEKMSSVTIPSSVNTIELNAFAECKGVTSITIPDGVTTIESGAFAGVPNIVYHGTATGAPWSALSMNGEVEGWLVYSDESKTHLLGCSASATGEVIIPESVTHIGNYAFYNCSGITTVTIPNSVTHIGDNAFERCVGITSVTIPEGVTNIGNFAFDGCSGITSIVLPQSLTTIDNFAFGYCSNLSSINFHNHITNIGDGIFNGCDNLLTPIYTDKVFVYLPKTYSGDYTIPSCIERIAGQAFQFCSSLTSITIPEGLTKIGMYAFTHCTNLSSVNIPNSVTEIGQYAFDYCIKLSSITLPPNITIIKDATFADCPITSIAIPNGVDSICFAAFQSCKELTSITLPDNLKYIGVQAFNGCSKLTSITLPDNVHTILGGAFGDCTGLISLTLPSSVTYLGTEDGTFWRGDPFRGCTNLASLTCEAVIPPICSIVSFETIDKSIPVYVPAESVEAYKAASQWKDFTNIQPIVEPESEEHTRTIYLHTGGPLFWSKNNPTLYIYAWTGDKQYTNIKLQHLNNYLFSAELDEKYTNLMFVKFDSNTTSFDLSKKQSLTKEFTVSDTNDMFTVTCDLLADGYDDYADGYWSKYDEAKENLIAYGTCGDNLSWEINEQGTLEFSGTGNMNNYSFYYYTWSPWYGYSSLVKSIILPNNLTNIGSYAFSYFDTITTITIPATVTEIGTEALNIQSLTSITCNAITPPQITSEPIGKTINHIGTRINKSIPLYVPAGSVNAYKSADYWKDFTNIQPIAEPFVFTNPVKIGDLYYNLDTIYGTAEVTYEKQDDEDNYAALSGELIIPSIVEYRGLPYNVTGIGSLALYFCTGITSVALPNSVTKIDEWAFANCRGLTSVNLGSITTIGNSAFAYCMALNAVTIPNSVTSIGNGAFEMCSSLSIVTCEATTPPSCGTDVFNRIATPNKLYVPAASILTYRLTSPWNEFSDIQTIIDPEKIENPVKIGDLYYNLYPENRTAKVTFQKYKATDNYAGLATADIPAVVEYGGLFFDVISIDDRAFHDCTNLSSVSIPNNVTSIGQFTFANCSGLKSIEIPNSVTKILTQAFAFCTGLTSIDIPNSVTELYGSSFGGCSNLKAINVASDNPAYYSVDGVVFNTNSQTAIIAFPGGKQESYDIPENVMHIAYYAFFNCSTLRSVTIPSSVKTIGDAAFLGCSGLTSITIPSSVQLIGDWAFENCTGLTSIICEAVEPPMLGAAVFYSIDKSIPLYVPAESVGAYKVADQWKDFTNIQPIVEPFVFTNPVKIGDLYYNLDTIYGTAEVTYESYANNMYNKGWNITTADIPASVEYRGMNFDVTAIGESAFYYCSKLTSVTIPNSVTTIGYAAFGNTGLTSIDIPGSVTTIGDRLCMSCGTLTAINVAEDNPTYHSIEGVLFKNTPMTLVACPVGKQGAFTVPDGVTSIHEWAFSNCTGLTDITLPNSVTLIERDAFYGCSGLTKMEIPGDVTSIGDYAFAGCKALPAIDVAADNTSFCTVDGVLFNKDTTLLLSYPGGREGDYIIPDGVTEIRNAAFYECRNLKDLTISGSVTRIGNSAFRYCTGLTSITCEAVTPPVCNNSMALANIAESIPVYVPAESVEAYKNASVWKDFGDNIQAIGVPQEFVNPVKIGDLFFNLDTVSQTAELTYDTADFEHNYRTINGNIDIPASVEYLGVTYPVTRVGKAAFVYCSHFLSVTIPNSITSIGEDAFATVPNIVYNGTATGSPWGARSVNGYVEGYWVYSDRSRTSLLACSAAAKGEVNVYRTVIVIADEAIAWCDSLTVVNIPSSVSSIGDWAFAYSDNIEAINVASENTTFSSVDGVLFNKDQTSLIKYPGGKKGEYIVPNTVTTIKKYACFMSNGLTAVTISNRVQTIEEMAFWYCSNLESVTIGSSVTEIGNQAFDYCNRLTSVTCEAIVPPACGAGTFYSVDKSIPVYVPAIGVEAYKAANGWKEFTNIQPIQAEEIAVTDIQAEPTDNSVVIEWPKVNEATVYTIEIKKNGELICTLTFNELGQLLNIAFAAPSRNGNRDSAQPRMALQTTTGWQYTISGLDPDTEYTYSVVAKRNASDTETLYNETITFTTKQTPTSVDEIQESSDTEVLKFIKNGQLLILRDGKTYTVTGAEVR